MSDESEPPSGWIPEAQALFALAAQMERRGIPTKEIANFLRWFADQIAPPPGRGQPKGSRFPLDVIAFVLLNENTSSRQIAKCLSEVHGKNPITGFQIQSLSALEKSIDRIRTKAGSTADQRADFWLKLMAQPKRASDKKSAD